MAVVKLSERGNNMASKQDTANRVAGCNQDQIIHNHKVAVAQVEKTNFRVQKVAVDADPFASGRLPIQEDRY